MVSTKGWIKLSWAHTSIFTVGTTLVPRTPRDFSIPFPASESVEFRDRHPMYTHVHLGLLDCIQLELVDEGLIIFMSMILDRLARGR